RVMLAVVLLLCLAAAVLVVLQFGSGYYALPGAWLAAGLICAGALGACAALGVGRTRLCVLVLAGTFVVFNYVFVARVLPGTERLKPVVPLAETLSARAAPSSAVGSYHLMLP